MGINTGKEIIVDKLNVAVYMCQQGFKCPVPCTTKCVFKQAIEALKGNMKET